jgi:RNA polymerase sigma-70 factor (ECF subfamily)
LRKRKRLEAINSIDEHVADLEDTSDWNDLELFENAELVHEALGQLSLPHREVLTLRFLEGLGLSEIAGIVGCSVGTVKSRLYYAKSAMRKLLEANCHE